MEISESKKNGVVILSVTGRLDASNAASLEQRLLALIDAGEQRLVVDGAQLDYISSAGLRVLLVAAKRLRSGSGEVALAALRDPVKEVLDIAGFSSIFKVHRTSDEAVVALQSAGNKSPA
jgi:anti-sigma B factor antagonist